MPATRLIMPFSSYFEILYFLSKNLETGYIYVIHGAPLPERYGLPPPAHRRTGRAAVFFQKPYAFSSAGCQPFLTLTAAESLPTAKAFGFSCQITVILRRQQSKKEPPRPKPEKLFQSGPIHARGNRRIRPTDHIVLPSYGVPSPDGLACFDYSSSFIRRTITAFCACRRFSASSKITSA